MRYTLKLDASWRPIEVIDCFKSVSMVLSGRANTVEEYNEEIYPGIKIPSVIVLKNYVRTIPFSKACNRKNVIWRDQYTCQYCQDQFTYKELTMDHVVPKSKGGSKTWLNIVASCKQCNGIKGHRLLHQTNLKLKKQPSVPKVTFSDLDHPCKITKEWKKYK
jgi:5-methylcytosine-specific restriction endonuclease McrA